MKKVFPLLILAAATVTGCASGSLEKYTSEFLESSEDKQKRQQIERYEEQRKGFPTHIVRCKQAPTSIEHAYTTGMKKSYYACQHPKFVAASREIAARWHATWKQRIASGTYHDRESEWQTTADYFIDLQGAWNREIGTFVNDLSSCVHRKDPAREECVSRMFDWKFKEPITGVPYQLANKRFKIDQALPLSGCHSRQTDYRESFDHTYCLNEVVAQSRNQIIATHRMQMHAQLNATGSLKGAYSKSHSSWANMIKSNCSGYGDKTGCINREIEWRLSELKGGDSTHDSRRAFQQAQQRQEQLEREQEKAQTLRNMANHANPVIRKIGACENLTAWGGEVYCDGNFIAKTQSIEKIVMDNTRAESGKPLSDSDRRALKQVVKSQLFAMDYASTVVPADYIKKQYGDVIFTLMGLAARVQP